MITFSTRSDCFKSMYERNMFYRGLYGWRQIIRKCYGTYEYYKSGVLDQIPHLRVDKSLFIVFHDDLEIVKEYFNMWGNKIRYNCFEIIITQDLADKLHLGNHEFED